MKLKIKNKDGVILKTKNTVVTEDIEVVPDESIINGSGSYEDGDELVYGGEKATQYGQVLVTNEKIDLMANEVLDMAGETQGQTLDELTTTLEGVNNEISTQGDLIAQLQAAVDSLPEAGSGGGGDFVYGEYSTVYININGDDISLSNMAVIWVHYRSPFSERFVMDAEEATVPTSETMEIFLVPNSIFVVYIHAEEAPLSDNDLENLSFSIGGLEYYSNTYSNTSKCYMFLAPPVNETATITINVTEN